MQASLSATSRARHLPGFWPQAGLALALVAAGTLGWQASTSRYIDVNGHCGFDGYFYCAMAKGHATILPYNHRVLTPWLVHLLEPVGGSILSRFLFIDLLAAALAAGAVAVLIHRFTDNRGAAVAGGALLLLNPWTWHISLSYPALTDETALALGLWWLVVVLGDRLQPLAVPLAAAAVLARESWLAPIAVVCLLLALDRTRDRRLLVATVIAAGGAGAYAFLRHSAPGAADWTGASFLPTARHWISSNFDGARNIARYVWFLAGGLGFFPLLLWGRFRVLFRDARRRALLAVAAVQILLATVGGGDTNRLLLPAFAVTLVLVIDLVHWRPDLRWAFALVAVATAAIWDPWRVTGPHQQQFIHAWGQRVLGWTAMDRIMLRDALVSAIPVAAAVLLVHRARRLPARRAYERPSSSGSGRARAW